MEHHENGPSSQYRRWACPGSMMAERGLPDVESEVATEGTEMHKAVETGVIPESFTIEQSEMVSRCLEFKDEICEGAKEVHSEKKLRLFGSRMQLLNFGTPDLVAVFDNYAIVPEWKFGRNEVDDEIDNRQMANQAAMVHQTFGVDSVTVKVIQPRLNRFDTEFTFTNFDAIIANIEAVDKRCDDEPNTFNPGAEQCKYCLAAQHGTCNAYTAWALSSIEVAEKKPMTHGDSGKLIAKYLDKLSEMNKMMERAKAMVIARWRETGERPANVNLKEVTNGHIATDVMGLYNQHKEDIAQEEFLKLCKPSVSDLRDLTIKKKGLRTEKGNLKRGEKERLTKAFYSVSGSTIEPRKKKVFVTVVADK